MTSTGTPPPFLRRGVERDRFGLWITNCRFSSVCCCVNRPSQVLLLVWVDPLFGVCVPAPVSVDAAELHWPGNQNIGVLCLFNCHIPDLLTSSCRHFVCGMFAWLPVAKFWCLVKWANVSVGSVESCKCSWIWDISVACICYTGLTVSVGRSFETWFRS
jgi:hypothetical protein